MWRQPWPTSLPSPTLHSSQDSQHSLHHEARRQIDALVKFARVVSDAGASPQDALSLLADALALHVCRSGGVGIFFLEPDAKLRLCAEKNLDAQAKSNATARAFDLDEIAELPANVAPRMTLRPLVAVGDLFGVVLMELDVAEGEGTQAEDEAAALALADGLIDLTATAVGTATHVAKLERQFEELRQQQDVLARTEKLRALGQMAAGISHDLRNILNPLSLHLQVITRALTKGNTVDAQESAAEMKQVLQRGLSSLERLRDFSRQSKEPKTELVELDHLAREAASIGKSRAGNGGRRVAEIDYEGLTAPPPVTAVSSDIVSAIVNLIVNAIDAMGESGQGNQIALRSGHDAEHCWIEVKDDGPGMRPDVAKRVFEPFFTTKGSEGTGLGLAMVYATMQRHGGTVTIETEPTKGTVFRLSFPKPGPTSLGAVRS